MIFTHKEIKTLQIACSDALGDPRAMMIVSSDANIASLTMVHVFVHFNFALLAIS